MCCEDVAGPLRICHVRHQIVVMAPKVPHAYVTDQERTVLWKTVVSGTSRRVLGQGNSRRHGMTCIQGLGSEMQPPRHGETVQRGGAGGMRNSARQGGEVMTTRQRRGNRLGTNEVEDVLTDATEIASQSQFADEFLTSPAPKHREQPARLRLCDGVGPNCRQPKQRPCA